MWGIGVVNDPGLGLRVVEEVAQVHPEHSAVGDAFHRVWSVLKESWSEGLEVSDTVGESLDPELSAGVVKVESVIGCSWESGAEIVLTSVSVECTSHCGNNVVGDNPSLPLKES